MSEFMIHKNGNCSLLTDDEAKDEIEIELDLDYLKMMNLDSLHRTCQETILCGDNYVSLRYEKYFTAKVHRQDCRICILPVLFSKTNLLSYDLLTASNETDSITASNETDLITSNIKSCSDKATG